LPEIKILAFRFPAYAVPTGNRRKTNEKKGLIPET